MEILIEKIVPNPIFVCILKNVAHAKRVSSFFLQFFFYHTRDKKKNTKANPLSSKSRKKKLIIIYEKCRSKSFFILSL